MKTCIIILTLVIIAVKSKDQYLIISCDEKLLFQSEEYKGYVSTFRDKDKINGNYHDYLILENEKYAENLVTYANRDNSRGVKFVNGAKFTTDPEKYVISRLECKTCSAHLLARNMDKDGCFNMRMKEKTCIASFQGARLWLWQKPVDGDDWKDCYKFKFIKAVEYRQKRMQMFTSYGKYYGEYYLVDSFERRYLTLEKDEDDGFTYGRMTYFTRDTDIRTIPEFKVQKQFGGKNDHSFYVYIPSKNHMAMASLGKNGWLKFDPQCEWCFFVLINYQIDSNNPFLMRRPEKHGTCFQLEESVNNKYPLSWWLKESKKQKKYIDCTTFKFVKKDRVRNIIENGRFRTRHDGSR